MSAAICPYCRTPIDEADQVLCQGCSTPHHADCLEENGGCTIFGCTEAPPAEPKLSIGAPELNAPAAAPPPPNPRPASPPPPPGRAPVEEVEAPPLFSSTGYRSPVPRAVPYPQPRAVPQLAVAPMSAEPNPEARTRSTYILLGILLGAFGVHSFYAGYVKKGLWQLAITVLTLGLAGFMTWIWALIDICTITHDNKGIPFRS